MLRKPFNIGHQQQFARVNVTKSTTHILYLKTYILWLPMANKQKCLVIIIIKRKRLPKLEKTSRNVFMTSWLIVMAKLYTVWATPYTLRMNMLF